MNKSDQSIGTTTHSNRNKATIKLNLLVTFAIAIFFGVLVLFKDQTNFPHIALVATILIVIVTLIFTWKWYQSLDEFEKLLLGQSGLIALYTGFAIALPAHVLYHFKFIDINLEAWHLIVMMSLISSIYYYTKKFITR